MKYARIKTYICLYIFIIFNPLGFLSISGNLHAFHRRIYDSSAYFFRRGSQEGLLGLPAPSFACRWASLSLRGHAWHTWWSQVPRPPPGSVLVVSSVRSAFSPRTSFLSMASLMPKRMRVRTFFRSSYCAHPCAQEGQACPCRAAHLFSVRSCPGRRNENCQGESDLPLDLGCRWVGQLVLSERGINSFISPSHPHQRAKLRDWPGWPSK